MTESYESVIRERGELVFTPGGVSMLPLLRHHENPVVLHPVEGRLKKGDVPFYKRESGQYVLHRIVKVRKDSYDLCGDNQVIVERGVTDGMIFAKMVGFYQGEAFVSVDEKWVRRYARRRMASRPFRYFVFRVKHFTSRVFCRLFGIGKQS